VSFPLAEQFADEVISIPVHPGVGPAERAHIVSTIEALARREREPARSERPAYRPSAAPSTRGSVAPIRMPRS
jgi:hypothetical protein